MSQFDYQRMYSLEDAFQLASSSNGNAAFLAGGTDLLLQIKNGAIHSQKVIDIKEIRELHGLVVTQDEFAIGAVTSIRDLETSDEIKKRLPIIAQSASKLGSIQVRNRATIGGNLCNAAPSSDMAPALLVLDAQAEIFGKTGLRNISLVDFFKGPGLTTLNKGEILTRLKIPLSKNSQGAIYYKLTFRNSMDLATVGVAIRLELNGENLITKCRIALGAVAPTPIRVQSAELILKGNSMNADLAHEAAALAMKTCQPITDHRASADYRRAMVGSLCQRGLLAVYEQAIEINRGDRE